MTIDEICKVATDLHFDVFRVMELHDKLPHERRTEEEIKRLINLFLEQISTEPSDDYELNDNHKMTFTPIVHHCHY
jgi:hypothetical protein